MWNILIAEDNPEDAQRLIKGLGNAAKCRVMNNGHDALEAYKECIEQGSFLDFILLDVQMPRKNGFEILKSIRKMEEAYLSDSSKRSKIIMVTTFKDSLMENYNMGWDEFISKPIDPIILKARLKELENSSSPT